MKYTLYGVFELFAFILILIDQEKSFRFAEVDMKSFYLG